MHVYSSAQSTYLCKTILNVGFSLISSICRISGNYLSKSANLKIFFQLQLRWDGTLGFPGGSIKDKEDLVKGLNRELKEELGIDRSNEGGIHKPRTWTFGGIHHR